MRSSKFFQVIRVISSFAMVIGLATSAHAQATRTWVSGVGDDVNPCSRTAPCKTFAGAISKTAAGGYINVLDPGGFGTLTITKSITVDGAGTHGGALASTVSGFTISFTPGIVVTIRNLTIESPNPNQGLHGIRVLVPAEVHLENLWIGNFSGKAVDFSPSPAGGDLFMNNVTMVNNGGGGVVLTTGGRAAITDSRAESNTGAGFSAAAAGALMTVRNSVASGNTIGFNVSGSGATVMNLENCLTASNSQGVAAFSGSSIRLSDTMVASNTSNGMQNDGISFIISLGGNELIGNLGTAAFNQTIAKQ